MRIAITHWGIGLLLSELDQAGRQRGVQVCSVDEALGYIAELGEETW